jgi:hypothetical protein
VYLPADYLDHPTRARPVLVLVSGGNGNRSRWFLSPTRPGGTIPATGGLAVRGRVDAWVREHPSAPAPLVVGLDGESDQFPEGLGTFLRRDLPAHLAATYLPAVPRARIPFGAECISSGCVALLAALRDDPSSYRAVGLLSPYVHPAGIDVAFFFGPPRARGRLFRDLVARHRAGAFELRFSIGVVDEHLARARALYRLLQAEGLYPADVAPTYDRCQAPGIQPNSSHCEARWPGLWLYPNVGHHYLALIPAFPPALAWQLDTLAAMVDRSPPPAPASP